MSNYNYHVDTILGWALPDALRQIKLFAFVRSLARPIKELHTRFLMYAKDVDFAVNHNGQVCYLRSALNKSFDPGLSRIVIEDGAQDGFVFIYNANESNPLYLSTFIAGSEASFIVKVPVEYSGQLAQISALVQRFKLFSKTFKIVFV